MNDLAITDSELKTMSSVEIAELTGKQHKHVLADIRKMLNELNIRSADFSAKETFANNRKREVFNLPKRECLILVSGYNVELRAKIIDRWQELENQEPKAVLPKDPILAAIVKSVQQIDEVKQQQLALQKENQAIKHKAEVMEARLENVELQHRNGVPEGYLSRKHAHHLYGQGLSWEIFFCALTELKVKSKRYVHKTDEGHEVSTVAFKEDEIGAAIVLFLQDAKQVTKCMCESPMLNDKRFRYKKTGLRVMA